MLSLFVDALALSLAPCLAWAVLFVGRRVLSPQRGGRTFAGGSIAGVALAAVIAALEHSTAWLSREVLELWLLPAFLVLVLLALLWCWAPADRTGSQPRWGFWLPGVLALGVAVVEVPDVFALVAAIVPYGASALTTDALANLGGFVLGLVTTGLTAWGICRASTGAGRGLVRVAVSLALLLLGLGQLVTLTKVILVRGLAELPSWTFGAVVFGVNHEWVATLGLALAGLLPVTSAVLVGRGSVRPAANPAQGRLLRASVLTRRRFIGLTGAGLAVAAVAVTAGRAAADTEVTLSPPEPLATDAGDVWVALSAIDDGHLHRFAYDATDGTEVRFIALRKSTNSFVAALDACNICGPAGYYEKDGQVICKMCGVAMNIATIGFTGGCNPIPIAYVVADGRLSVQRSVLQANAKIFG